MKKLSKIVSISLMLAILFMIVPLVAITENPPPLPPSTGGGGSSSGGGGGSSYSAPVFAAYTLPIKSSDGTVIGHLDGKNFNSVLVWAEKNGTVGNTTYDLTVTGELSSKPSDDCRLDIGFLSPDAVAVPPGMEDGLVLGVLNITKYPADWSYKSSPTYTLTITGSNQSVNPTDPYYLVRSDGSGYQLQHLDISSSGNQSVVKFNPPGDTGVFTILRAPMATPTPTPTPPTPLPTETPTSTPLPVSGGMWTYPIFLVLFLVGVVVGAAALYLLNIHR